MRCEKLSSLGLIDELFKAIKPLGPKLTFVKQFRLFQHFTAYILFYSLNAVSVD